MREYSEHCYEAAARVYSQPLQALVDVTRVRRAKMRVAIHH